VNGRVTFVVEAASYDGTVVAIIRGDHGVLIEVKHELKLYSERKCVLCIHAKKHIGVGG
jgi:hypothetical protein